MRIIAAIACTVATAALAQWPQQPVKIIVPYSPGGTVDFSARQIAQKLTESLGKPCVVENKTGASGTIGMGAAAQAAPDGYTLAMPALSAFVAAAGAAAPLPIQATASKPG